MSLLSKMFRYIWPLASRYKWLLFLVCFLFSFRVLVDFIIIPIYFQRFIDIISETDIEKFLVSGQVINIILLIIILDFLHVVASRLRSVFFAKFMVNMTKDLRDYAFKKISENSHGFFANNFSGSLVTKVRRFVGSFDTISEILIFKFLSITILLIGSFVVIFLKFPTIAYLFFGMILVYIISVMFLVKTKMRYDLEEAAQDSKISGRLADTFSNILAVKFFSARSREIESFGQYTEEGKRKSFRAWHYANVIDLLQSAFSFLIHGIVLYVLAQFWTADKISTGEVVLIYTYVNIILMHLWELSNSLVRLMKSVSDMKEMVDIFEIRPDVLDPQRPEKPSIVQGNIVFKDVVFNYDFGAPVLDNFNLEIKRGERVGIVGHSGAGKSTITKILLRLNDISSGVVEIDGQDIRNIKQDDLRSAISYVPQEPILFHRPIRENIAYGKPKASMEEIIEVSKKAHAHEFISMLPQGYDTLVGERGVKLSGGERQRVAIARAMLKDAPILILDEATSSLDSVSESLIQDAFDELMKGKTTIVIAHRLSTIQKMDRIIVLDKGKIVEEGKHIELLAKGGVYADLWNHQTGGFLE